MTVRCLLASAFLALLGLPACSDASGSVQGGEVLFDAGVPVTPDAGPVAVDDAGPHAWTDLYNDFFGASTGAASCAGTPGQCHMLPNDLGSGFSGFTCGTTQDSCWMGMTVGNCASALVKPCPIVPSGGSAAPTSTGLHINLHQSDATGTITGTMPLGDTYTFTPADMARIDAWITEGAQNN
jgi:hypothetical protein